MKRNLKRGQDKVNSKKCHICGHTNRSHMGTCVSCFHIKFYYPKMKQVKKIRYEK